MSDPDPIAQQVSVARTESGRLLVQIPQEMPADIALELFSAAVRRLDDERLARRIARVLVEEIAKAQRDARVVGPDGQPIVASEGVVRPVS